MTCICEYNEKTNRCIKKKNITEKNKWDKKIKILKKYQIYLLDVGGGGNCLFYCLKYGFNMIYEKSSKHTTGETRIYKNLKDDPLYFRKQSMKSLTMKKLNETAKEFSQDFKNAKDKKIFLSQYYKQEAYWYLFGFHSKTRIKTLTQSKTKKDALILAKQYKMESNHWGSEYDIHIFEKNTNIGVIIFQIRDNHIFYCDAKLDKYDRYILIYNYDQYHFEIAGIKDSKNNITCASDRNELPIWLTSTYFKECLHHL